jgi:hypothetical protein
MSDPAGPQLLESAMIEFWGNGLVVWTDDRLLVATSLGVYISEDNGRSWTTAPQRSGLEEITLDADPIQPNIPRDDTSRPHGFSAIVVDPSNPDRIWLASELGAYLSSDGGYRWRRVGAEVEVESIAISPAVDRVFVTTAEGMTLTFTLTGN